MLAALKRSLRRRGLMGTVRAAAFGLKCQHAVRGKRGLEIGGPSDMFHRMIPVYPAMRSLDNCVFSTETVWEGKREDGAPFGSWGRNRVVDAVDLADIHDHEYDFVLSCHSLEHIANPVKALHNWKRVAPMLVLVLPYCRETFDHLRPVTSLSHMIEDFERNVGEDDLMHLEEAIALSDLSRLTLKDETLEEAQRRIDPRKNPSNRCIHHHVFDEKNSVELLSHCGYCVVAQQTQAASVCLLATSSRLT